MTAFSEVSFSSRDCLQLKVGTLEVVTVRQLGIEKEKLEIDEIINCLNVACV